MNEPTPNSNPNPGDPSVSPAGAPISIEMALQVLQDFISRSYTTQTKAAASASVPGEQVMINADLLRWILRQALAGYMGTAQAPASAPPANPTPTTPLLPAPATTPPPSPAPSAAS